MRSSTRWVPVLFWMALIFLASTDSFSAQHTGHFLIPLLLRFFPNLSSQAIDVIHLCVRKGAHLTEYGVLGILLWRALPEQRTNPRLADWWRAGLSVLVATCYGATDEYHQSFVPSRGPSVHDVLIDGCGAAIAVAIVCLASRRRNFPHGQAPPFPAP